MKQKVTRNDVAKLAGVSPAVVSYVMNNSNYVSTEKRKAVLSAVEELGYTPNIFAKSLRTNRSHQIALVGDTLQAELYGTLSSCLFEKGYFSSLFFSRKEDAFINKLIEGRFDAIFMASNGFTASQLNRLVEEGSGLILYQSREYEGLDPRIVIRVPDFYDGMKKLVSYLLLKGHRRICLVPPIRYRTDGANSNDFRTRAYSDTLKENGIAIDPRFFCIHTETAESILNDIFVMLTSCREEERPTAFIASDDHLAAQVMQYLKKLNLRIPQDAAVVGWGNIASSQITTPEMTTFDDQIPYFAGQVADALVSLAEGKQPENRYYKGQLIIRESA